MKRVTLLVLLVLACGKEAVPKDAPRNTPSAPAPQLPATPAELPPMPRYPDAGPGRMVVQTAGVKNGEEVRQDWSAQAGWCETPPMLQVKAEQVAVGGALVLLALPENKITTYPVTLVNQGLPTPPASQVALQVFSRVTSVAYQAVDGAVDLYAWGKTVSGRFGVTLREINRNDSVRLVGTFREVPLVKLDSALCAPAAAGAKTGR